MSILSVKKMCLWTCFVFIFGGTFYVGKVSNANAKSIEKSNNKLLPEELLKQLPQGEEGVRDYCEKKTKKEEQDPKSAVYSRRKQNAGKVGAHELNTRLRKDTLKKCVATVSKRIRDLKDIIADRTQSLEVPQE